MKKKKVIVYLHRYPLEYESNLFPATRKLLDLLIKKYEVIYVSFKPISKKNEALRKGITIRELPFTIDRKSAKDKWIKMFIWYLNIWNIRKIIKENNASFIVHKEQLPFIPSILARMKIPMLLDIGDWWWSTLLCKYNLEKVSEKIENVEIRDWNKFKNLYLSTHSKAEAEMIYERGMDIKRMTVINQSSNDKTFKPVDARDIRKKLGLKDTDWVVAVHGIIHPSKDYGLLLKWWAKISAKHNNWKLLNIGGTMGEEWYKKRIKELNIEDSTILTGWIDGPGELNKYLNAADCLLVTRKNNLANRGLIPSSLHHSMSIGKPLVVTGLAGLTENVQNGINGYSYIPDSYESFEKTLEHIYNNPKEARKVGLAGIARGKECFDLDKSARNFFNLIDRNIKK